MHVYVRPGPYTRTERGLRFPPQYINLNSQYPQDPKMEPSYVCQNKKKTSVSGKGTPPPLSLSLSMFPQQGFYGERCSVPRANIRSFISVRVPEKEPSHEMRGETYSHSPRSPTRTEILHTMGCGLVPQGGR